MIDLPTDEIAALCVKYAVNRLWVFGSAVTSEFNPATSDIDFLVEFQPPPEGMGLAAQFFDFWDDLKRVLNRNVDLVERSAITNPHFKRAIEEQEVLLFAA